MHKQDLNVAEVLDDGRVLFESFDSRAVWRVTASLANILPHEKITALCDLSGVLIYVLRTAPRDTMSASPYRRWIALWDLPRAAWMDDS